jgi:hypothetical protein
MFPPLRESKVLLRAVELSVAPVQSTPEIALTSSTSAVEWRPIILKASPNEALLPKGQCFEGGDADLAWPGPKLARS